MRMLVLASSLAAMLATIDQARAADQTFKTGAPLPAWSWSWSGCAGGPAGPVCPEQRMETGREWPSLTQTIDAAFVAIGRTHPGFTIVPHLELVASQRDLSSTYRTRAGVLANDQLLIFGTAGLAFGRPPSDITAFGRNAGPGQPVLAGAALTARDAQRLGGVVGGGVEWAFADRWQLRAEYLYTGFRSADPSMLPGSASGYATTAPQREHLLRGGVNYQFDPLAPGGRS
jgi:hypothetical protein